MRENHPGGTTAFSWGWARDEPGAPRRKRRKNEQRRHARQSWGDRGHRGPSEAYPPGQTKKEAKKRSEAAARHDDSASADRLRVGRTLFGGACALTSGSWYASPVVVFHRSTVSAAHVSAVTIGRHEWPVLQHGTTWFTINVALFPREAGCRPRSFQEPGNGIREQWVLCSEWHMIPRCHPRSNECAMNAPSLSRIRKCCERTVAAAVHARSRRSLNARRTWYCASGVMAMLYIESHMAK